MQRNENYNNNNNNEETSHNFINQSLLTSLPKDLLLPAQSAQQDSSITSVASESDATNIMCTLSKTCKIMHRLFKPELQKRKFAKYIVDANQDKIEAMVTADHSLLFIPLDIVNKNTNQVIKNYTLMQLAYCEGDDEMCLMLAHYFELACGSVDAGREEIRKQLNEKFGAENNEEKEKNKKLIKEHLSAILKPVIQAITNEQFNNSDDANGKLILSDATLKAIATFRDEFAASQPKIITSGRRFHLETLQEVCEAYAHQAPQWNYNYNKCALLEDAILSFVLIYVSNNDAQRFNQGLHYLQNKGEKFKRASETRDGHKFYPALKNSSADFSLSGSCVDIVDGLAHGRDRDLRMLSLRFVRCLASLQNLYVEKTSNLQYLWYLCSHARKRKSLSA